MEARKIPAPTIACPLLGAAYSKAESYSWLDWVERSYERQGFVAHLNRGSNTCSPITIPFGTEADDDRLAREFHAFLPEPESLVAFSAPVRT